MSLKIALCSSDAIMPTRATTGSAGLDLHSVESVEIPPCSRALIKTGIVIQMPDEVYARIAPRSGLAFKHGIDVMAGVIDQDYRGEIGVILFNSDSNNSFVVQKGDRIAQIIFERIWIPETIQNVQINDLVNTERNSSGFGSSGV